MRLLINGDKYQIIEGEFPALADPYKSRLLACEVVKVAVTPPDRPNDFEIDAVIAAARELVAGRRRAPLKKAACTHNYFHRNPRDPYVCERHDKPILRGANHPTGATLLTALIEALDDLKKAEDTPPIAPDADTEIEIEILGEV